MRPKTLGISIAPVITGAALAWVEQESWAWLTLLVTLFAALMIQIGTNLYNDAVDFERGTDTPNRLGPKRASAQGWFSSTTVKRAAYLSFGLALVGGIYLAWIGGWPIVAIGLLSMTAGLGYTGGPRPIAYSPSGEIFVFIFFGLIAVTGSYYLQCGRLSWNSLLLASGIGSLASAVMLVNNYRDLDSDRQANKLTLVHYLGRRKTCLLFALLILLPYLLPLLLSDTGAGVWLPLACLPMSIYLVRRFSMERPGAAFNRILANTAQLQLLYAILLTGGLVLWN